MPFGGSPERPGKSKGGRQEEDGQLARARCEHASAIQRPGPFWFSLGVWSEKISHTTGEAPGAAIFSLKRKFSGWIILGSYFLSLHLK